jgi:hypothetical protein
VGTLDLTVVAESFECFTLFLRLEFVTLEGLVGGQDVPGKCCTGKETGIGRGN